MDAKTQDSRQKNGGGTVAFICPFSEAGASASRLIHLAGGFDDKFLILPKTDKYGSSKSRDWLYFPVERKSFILLPLWWLRSAAALLRRKPRAVVFQKPHLFTLPPALLYHALTGRPIVFDCDEWDPATLRDNDEPVWKITLTEALANMGFRFSALIVYANHLTADERIPARFRGKSVYIPNGVDTGSFKPGLAGHDGFVVMYVGMLYKIRHILPLVDAIGSARKRVKNMSCTIVGGGKRLDELKALAESKGLGGAFNFTGMVGHDMLPDIMRRADVLVAPFEDLPGIRYQSNVKVFEYMAAGKPIVASRVGELDDVLGGGKCGILVPPGDSEALADALVKVSEDGPKAADMGREAVLKAGREYDWRLLGERLRRKVDEVCENKYV